MRCLLCVVLLSGVLSLNPEQCNQVVSTELEYVCTYNQSTVTFAGQNDYVRIDCEGADITCGDVPHFNFGNGLPLNSLGMTSCPPRLLQCVYSIVNTTGVEYLILTRMTAELIEEDVKNLGAVNMLMIMQAGVQKSLPIAAINSLKNLRNLRIGGGDFQLSPHSFINAPPLVYLELHTSNIRSIPVDAFVGLRDLNELNIWGNNINNISVGAFNGLENVKVLTLNTNKLRYIEPGSLRSMPNLKSLQLTGNELKLLPNDMLKGLEYIENITVFMNRVDLKLDTNTFKDLPKLKKVDLQNCGISILPSQLFHNSTNVEILELNSNKIKSVSSELFLNIKALKHLDLSFNNIEGFDDSSSPFIGLSKMEYLNLNRNHIKKLPEGLFSKQRSLRELYMEHNSITSIAFTTFQGASNLETLSLASNHLTFEPNNETYQFLENTTPLQFLKSLKSLNLSGNQIRTMFDDWRFVLLQLQYLDLSWNSFKELDWYQLDFMRESITVNVKHNEISHVALKPLPNLKPSGDYKESIKYLLLDDNPIICDCYMYGLKLRIDNYTPEWELKVVLDKARCAAPPNLKGKLIKQVPAKDLICQLHDYCPKNCTCKAKVATSELIIDCLKLPSELPDVTSDNISFYFTQKPTITLNLKEQPKNINNFDIHTLNLSDANMEKIIFRPSKSLRILDVSQNRLNTVPLDFIESNITLYLAGNTLECDCGSMDAISALKKYNYAADLSKTICDNGEFVSDIDVTALCNNLKAAITASATFLILLTIFVITITLVYRYYYEIMLYLSTRCCSGCIQTIKPDSEKDYDIFLSFAHEDFNFIEDVLLPKLENEFHQKVCVHYRDWMVGDLIPTQIVRSVENSRKTVIVMSKNFLESVWANLEFSAAHNLALQEQKARVILILLDEDVTKHEKVSLELKAYINTNTYLVWQDPKFWDRLRDALPREEHRFKLFEILKQKGGEKSAKKGLNVRLNSEGKLVNLAADNIDFVKDLPEDV